VTSRKTVIVTGASSGVGRATATMLLEHGHRVVGLDIKTPDYALSAFHLCDLARQESIDAVHGKLDGRYDSVMNVAGVPLSLGAETTIKVNILGLRHFTDGIWDRIEDNGTIVNVSSLAGNNWRKRRSELTELLATPSFSAGLEWWNANGSELGADAYIVSKEAVALYSMMLAERGLDRGINVNSIGPGPVETQLLPAFTRDAGEEAMMHYISIVGRAAQPEDIAEAIVVLAERKIGWLNAMHLNIDGGLTTALSLGWKPRGKA
jgi:NAD(P)-dependent dehydrogenase (short-subunit alcohol dehydrogenase family)